MRSGNDLAEHESTYPMSDQVQIILQNDNECVLDQGIEISESLEKKDQNNISNLPDRVGIKYSKLEESEAERAYEERKRRIQDSLRKKGSLRRGKKSMSKGNLTEESTSDIRKEKEDTINQSDTELKAQTLDFSPIKEGLPTSQSVQFDLNKPSNGGPRVKILKVPRGLLEYPEVIKGASESDIYKYKYNNNEQLKSPKFPINAINPEPPKIKNTYNPNMSPHGKLWDFLSKANEKLLNSAEIRVQEIVDQNSNIQATLDRIKQKERELGKLIHKGEQRAITPGNIYASTHFSEEGELLKELQIIDHRLCEKGIGGDMEYNIQDLHNNIQDTHNNSIPNHIYSRNEGNIHSPLEELTSSIKLRKEEYKNVIQSQLRLDKSLSPANTRSPVLSYRDHIQGSNIPIHTLLSPVDHVKQTPIHLSPFQPEHNNLREDKDQNKEEAVVDREEPIKFIPRTKKTISQRINTPTIYQRTTDWKKEKEIRHQQMKLAKETETMNNYSFKPTIQSNSSILGNMIQSDQDIPFYERNMKWLESKEKNLNSIKNVISKEEARDYTFHPKRRKGTKEKYGEAFSFDDFYARNIKWKQIKQLEAEQKINDMFPYPTTNVRTNKVIKRKQVTNSESKSKLRENIGVNSANCSVVTKFKSKINPPKSLKTKSTRCTPVEKVDLKGFNLTQKDLDTKKLINDSVEIKYELEMHNFKGLVKQLKTQFRHLTTENKRIPKGQITNKNMKGRNKCISLENEYRTYKAQRVPIDYSTFDSIINDQNIPNNLQNINNLQRNGVDIMRNEYLQNSGISNKYIERNTPNKDLGICLNLDTKLEKESEGNRSTNYKDYVPDLTNSADSDSYIYEQPSDTSINNEETEFHRYSKLKQEMADMKRNFELVRVQNSHLESDVLRMQLDKNKKQLNNYINNK